MRKIILLFVFMLAMNASAQKVYNLDKAKDSTSLQMTKDKAVYKGQEYPVYVSKNGKYFIIVTSKNGNKYRKYIKTV